MPPKGRKKSIARPLPRLSTAQRRASHALSEASTAADDDFNDGGDADAVGAMGADAAMDGAPSQEMLAAMLPSAPPPRRPQETRPAFDFSSFGQVPTGPSIGVIQ